MANYLNVSFLSNNADNAVLNLTRHFLHFNYPYYFHGNETPSTSPSAFVNDTSLKPAIWSTTLIVVVAVAAYIALSFLACVVYKCLKRRGVRGPTCPPITCPKLACFNGQCSNKYSTSCASVWKKCCPTKLPNCEKLVTCHGMNLDCGMFDKCQGDNRQKWMPKWKGSSPTVPPWLKNYCANACCCCFENGNCRFLCLECKVRTGDDGQKAKTEGGQQGATNGVDQSLDMGQYPFYPGMTQGYATMQPRQQHPWSTTASTAPSLQPMGPYPTATSSYQPISFLNQQYSWARPVGPSGSPFMPTSPSPQPFQYSPTPFAFRPPLPPLAYSLANATTNDAERAAQVLLDTADHEVPSATT